MSQLFTNSRLAESLISDGADMNFWICATADESTGVEKTNGKSRTEDTEEEEDEIGEDDDDEEASADDSATDERGKKTKVVDEHTPTYAGNDTLSIAEGKRLKDLACGHRLTIEGTATVDLKAEQSLNEEGGIGFTRPKLAGFTMTANTGAPMRLAGWKYPVVLDMEGVQIPRQRSPVRLGHDPMHGVGHTNAITVDRKNWQLNASGVISRDTEAAREVKAAAKNGFPWQASVGASADDIEFVREGQKAAANGREYEGPVNIARRSTLGEISFVDSGADPHTEAMIANIGVPRIAASKDGEDDIDTQRPRDGAEAIDQAIRRKEREDVRQEGIQALVDEALAYRGANTATIKAIAKKALDEGWDVKDTNLALIRANRGKIPAAEYAVPASRQVMEAALLMACLPNGGDEIVAKDRDYGPEVAAEAWQYRSRGLRGTICAALEMSGMRVPHGSRELYDAILESQSRHSIQAAGFSTVNLPGLLGNVANKILLQAFLAMQATYDRIADQADFSNFHVHSIFRLEQTGDFAIVKPDGEIEHGALEQDAYTSKLDTYGRMLTLTRQSIINDDLNAFQSLTAQLARRARIAVEKALFALIAEASDVFYTVARGNRFTSSSLNISTIAQAEAALFNQQDANGDPIYAQARFLVVPPALKFLAEQIYTSQLVNDFTTGVARPTDNPYRGRYEPISSPMLQSANIAGNSSSTWYLLADPLMLPAFQVAYLDGRRAPTIETADTLFNTLGLQMRCYWDFGVAALDYRGANKSTA